MSTKKNKKPKSKPKRNSTKLNLIDQPLTERNLVDHPLTSTSHKGTLGSDLLKESNDYGEIYTSKRTLGLGKSLYAGTLNVSPRIISEGSLGTSIYSVNDLATGLGVGIANHQLNVGFGTVMANQNSILQKLVPQASFTTAMGTAIKPPDYLVNVIAPMSGAIVDLGLASTKVNSLLVGGALTQLQLTFTNNVSSLCLGTLQNQQLGILRDIPNGLSSFSTSLSGPTKILGEGISTIMRSLPSYPSELKLPNLEIVHKAAEVVNEELTVHGKKLDSMLAKISPELVEFRRGCWDTFTEKGRDYIGQSSSSMRRLVDTLLRTLAPDEKVKASNYFKNSPSAKSEKGNPTRKARIHFAVKYDTKKSNHLERLMKGFDELYDNLSAWDHTPLKKDDFVYGTFLTIEGCLVSLLSEVEL